MNPIINNYRADIVPEPSTGKVVDGNTFTAIAHIDLIDLHYRSRFQLEGVERPNLKLDKSAEAKRQADAARDCLSLILIGPTALTAKSLDRPQMGYEVLLSPNKPNVWNRSFVRIYRQLVRQSAIYPHLCHRGAGIWYLDVNKLMFQLGNYKFDVAKAHEALTAFEFAGLSVGVASPIPTTMEKAVAE